MIMIWRGFIWRPPKQTQRLLKQMKLPQRPTLAPQTPHWSLQNLEALWLACWLMQILATTSNTLTQASRCCGSLHHSARAVGSL
jgi:hypothetical protein